MTDDLRMSAPDRAEHPARPSARKPRGRPATLDREATLEAAMHVFWAHGYDGSSISHLVATTGVTPARLYHAFRSKERLFIEALDRYVAGHGRRLAKTCGSASTARAAIERWLVQAARQFVEAGHPRGSMIVASTNCDGDSKTACEALKQRRADEAADVDACIRRAIDTGELPADTDSRELTEFFTTVYRGLSVQATDGADEDALLSIVRRAMNAWPAA